MNKLNLPDNIIRLRHEKKLTQEELADFMGVTKASVSKWEKGINTPELLLLLKALLHFEKCVNGLLEAEQIKLHGDEYFDLREEFRRLVSRVTAEVSRERE